MEHALVEETSDAPIAGLGHQTPASENMRCVQAIAALC